MRRIFIRRPSFILTMKDILFDNISGEDNLRQVFPDPPLKYSPGLLKSFSDNLR